MALTNGVLRTCYKCATMFRTSSFPGYEIHPNIIAKEISMRACLLGNNVAKLVRTNTYVIRCMVGQQALVTLTHPVNGRKIFHHPRH